MKYRDDHQQPGLFADNESPVQVHDVLAAVQVAPSHAELLWKEGLLSYPPSPDRQLSRSEYRELVFLGHLARSPLSLHAITCMLESLDPPYAYSHEEIYYDWSSAEWLRIPHFEGVDLPGLVAQTRDHEDLKAIADAIRTRLED